MIEKISQVNATERTRPVAQETQSAQSNFAGILQTKLNTKDLDQIFEEAAAKYGLPVNLLKAVAKAESNFDANAVSSCGAMGIMQLMPATAKSLKVDNPFDAEENINGGARYLSYLYNKYDGDLNLTLAAYNAGPGNVAKYDGVPPFTETQNYIKKINTYLGNDITVPDLQTNIQGPALLANIYPGTAITGNSLDVGNSMTSEEYLQLAQLRMLSVVVSEMGGDDNDSSSSRKTDFLIDTIEDIYLKNTL